MTVTACNSECYHGEDAATDQSRGLVTVQSVSGEPAAIHRPAAAGDGLVAMLARAVQRQHAGPWLACVAQRCVASWATADPNAISGSAPAQCLNLGEGRVGCLLSKCILIMA